MAIINTALGGTDASDGDVLYAAGLNDTFDAAYNKILTGVKANSVGLKRTHTAAIGAVLSKTTWLRANGTAVQKTTNSGGAWVTKYTSTSALAKFYRNPMDSDYAIMFVLNTTVAEAAYTTDAGETFTNVDISALAFTSASPIFFSVTTNGRVYVMYSDSSDSNNSCLRYTDNDGTNWTEITGFTDRTITQGEGIDYARVCAPVDGVIAILVFDSSDASGSVSAAYSLNNGSSWSEVTDSGNSVSPSNLARLTCLYIDSDNYFINSEFTRDGDGSDDGLHTVYWKGTDISTTTQSFFAPSDENSYGRLFRFSSTDMILWVSTRTSLPIQMAIVRYDNNGDYIIMSGFASGNISSQFGWVDWDSNTAFNYIGVSATSGEHICRSDNNAFSSSGSVPIWDIWTGF